MRNCIEIDYPNAATYFGEITSFGLNNYSAASFGRGNPKANSQFRNSNSEQFIMKGVGIYMYPNSDVYFGEWKNDSFDGHGVYIFNTGEIYEGELKQGQKNGVGIYYYDHASAFYEGEWLNE